VKRCSRERDAPKERPMTVRCPPRGGCNSLSVPRIEPRTATGFTERLPRPVASFGRGTPPATLPFETVLEDVRANENDVVDEESIRAAHAGGVGADHDVVEEVRIRRQHIHWQVGQ